MEDVEESLVGQLTKEENDQMENVLDITIQLESEDKLTALEDNQQNVEMGEVKEIMTEQKADEVEIALEAVKENDLLQDENQVTEVFLIVEEPKEEEAAISSEEIQGAEETIEEPAALTEVKNEDFDVDMQTEEAP